MLWTAAALAFLYLLPGAAAAGLFAGRLRWNPLLWILLSLICLPVGLSSIGTMGVPMRSRVDVVAAVTEVSLFLFVATEAARRRGWVLALAPPRQAEDSKAARLLAAVLVLALTALIAYTRTALVSGHMPTVVDDDYRIAHLTAIAVTGVPPRNAFLPEAPLSYYYYDLVLPGLAVRLAEPQLTIAWALALHVVLQTLAVSAAIAALAFRLLRPWTALLGTWWLTVGATWAVWPLSLLKGQAGFTRQAFSGGKFLLQLFATLNAWVPQHMIAGATVVFAAALMTCIEGALGLRAVVLGVLLAFVAGSSVFVSLGLGAGIALWLLLAKPARAEAWGRREILLALATAAPLCIALIPIYAHRDMPFSLNPVESEAGEAAPVSLGAFALAQLAGAWRIPIHLLVDGGVPFALFAVWLWRERRRLRDDARSGFLAATGVAFLPLPYLLRSSLFNDFGMRGIIPAEFAWALAGVLLLDGLPRGRARTLLWAFALCGTAATLPGIAEDFRYIANPRQARPIAGHIDYLNRTTRLDDPVVVVSGLRFVRGLSRYPLERVRLIDPFFIRKLDSIDRQYLQSAEALGLPAEPSTIRTRAEVCAQAARVGRNSGRVVALALAQAAVDASLGAPEYSDGEWSVYAVTCPP